MATYTCTLLYCCWLGKTRTTYLRRCFNDCYIILSVSNMDDYIRGILSRLTILTGKYGYILWVGHRTATVSEVFRSVAWTSTRMATFTCILLYCWHKAIAKRIPFLSDGFEYCCRDFVREQHGRYKIRNLFTVEDYDRKCIFKWRFQILLQEFCQLATIWTI